MDFGIKLQWGSHDCDIVISCVIYWMYYIVMLDVAKLNEISEGSMRRVKAFNTHLLLSNVRVKI